MPNMATATAKSACERVLYGEPAARLPKASEVAHPSREPAEVDRGARAADKIGRTSGGGRRLLDSTGKVGEGELQLARVVARALVELDEPYGGGARVLPVAGAGWPQELGEVPPGAVGTDGDHEPAVQLLCSEGCHRGSEPPEEVRAPRRGLDDGGGLGGSRGQRIVIRIGPERQHRGGVGLRASPRE